MRNDDRIKIGAGDHRDIELGDECDNSGSWRHSSRSPAAAYFWATHKQCGRQNNIQPRADRNRQYVSKRNDRKIGSAPSLENRCVTSHIVQTCSSPKCPSSIAKDRYSPRDVFGTDRPRRSWRNSSQHIGRRITRGALQACAKLNNWDLA